MNRKEFAEIAISALRKWQDHNATLRAAALAFFIILPLPSVLLISADIYSQVYGQAQGIQQLIIQISAFLGPTIGNLVGQLLQGSSNPLNSVFNSVFSIIFAAAGVVGAFAVLQDTFNVLWDVTLPKHRSVKTRLQERVVSFDLVLVAAAIAFGFLAFTNLVLGIFRDILQMNIGTFGASVLLLLFQGVFSFGSAILLFAIIFKEIPDTHVGWGDVWLGAVITGIVFTIVNNIFRFYLQTFPVTSLAVAAGSLIILLLWVFVIAQILLYGAQFTKCYAESVGSHGEMGEDHKHPWKRLKQIQQAEVADTEFAKVSMESRFGESDKENELSTKTETEKVEQINLENNETSEPEKQLSPASESNEEEPQQPNPQIILSETKSSNASETEYDLNVNRRTKKKPSRRKESS